MYLKQEKLLTLFILLLLIIPFMSISDMYNMLLLRNAIRMSGNTFGMKLHSYINGLSGSAAVSWPRIQQKLQR